MKQREKELLREIECQQDIIRLKDEMIEILRDRVSFQKEVLKDYKENMLSLNMTIKNNNLLKEMLLNISEN